MVPTIIVGTIFRYEIERFWDQTVLPFFAAYAAKQSRVLRTLSVTRNSGWIHGRRAFVTEVYTTG
jgi:hypothetical protein